MLGSPSLRRPRGLMTPRGPRMLAVLLVVTLGLMLYFGGRREPALRAPVIAPPSTPPDEPARAPDASAVSADAGRERL